MEEGIDERNADFSGAYRTPLLISAHLRESCSSAVEKSKYTAEGHDEHRGEDWIDR
jgi:hypothetical protein